MKLYHVSKSRSTRILWLLEELGLEYDCEAMPFGPEALQSPDYLAINAFGKVPALIDGPVTMAESVAIVQYILDRYADGALEPDRDAPEYGKFLQWLEFGEATLMGPVANIMLHGQFLPEAERDSRSLERNRKTLSAYLGVLDEELADHKYLVGNDFTAADIVVGYGIFALKLFREMPTGFANVENWFERLSARPAYQKATAA
ncbi:MAG: glutathione S-transferase family protein [Gammaproteobacteria bacterium]|nr:glutathione S-transferase family protein [Gammaproteobacteria bacterium]